MKITSSQRNMIHNNLLRHLSEDMVRVKDVVESDATVSQKRNTSELTEIQEISIA